MTCLLQMARLATCLAPSLLAIASLQTKRAHRWHCVGVPCPSCKHRTQYSKMVVGASRHAANSRHSRRATRVSHFLGARIIQSKCKWPHLVRRIFHASIAMFRRRNARSHPIRAHATKRRPAAGRLLLGSHTPSAKLRASCITPYHRIDEETLVADSDTGTWRRRKRKKIYFRVGHDVDSLRSKLSSSRISASEIAQTNDAS